MKCLSEICHNCFPKAGLRPAAQRGIIHIDKTELDQFQKELHGKKLLFLKGFGQDDWKPIDKFDGFLEHNNDEMLKQIQDTVRSFGLTTQDYVVIDGDPVKAGFQVFVRWVIKETGCQLIWAKKLPAATVPEEVQQKTKDRLWDQVKTWAEELRPFNTTVTFLEITSESQDQEMLKTFGSALLATGAERPKYNSPVLFFDHEGDMQTQMKRGVHEHPVIEACASFIEEYARHTPMEFCALENAAKGLVIRSTLRPYAQSTLTLLIGGGQSSILEAAVCTVLDRVNPDTELAVFPASRGKSDKDPKMTKVSPNWIK